jgi:putative acyl-CoA dehydrogenase
VLTREPASIEALRKELALASGTSAGFDRATSDLDAQLVDVARDPASAQRQARHLAGRIATLLQASLLLRHSPPAVADAFVATRIASATAASLGLVGAIPDAVDAAAIVARATPRPDVGG